MITNHYFNFLHRIGSWLPWVGLLALIIAVTTLLVAVILRILSLRHLARQKVVYMELTPPAFTDRATPATEQLFAALHGLGLARLLRDRLLSRKSVYSLEIVSTRKDGIRYIVRVADDRADTLEHTVSAYLPEVKVRRMQDYLPSLRSPKTTRIVEFRQKEHFAYPLQSFELLESHDPIGYITSAMTKLSPDELIAFQVVMTPVRSAKAESIRRLILSNEDLLPQLGRSSGAYLHKIFGAINSVLFGLTGAVGSVVNGPSQAGYQASVKEAEYKKQIARHLKPVRTLSYFEHELIESIHQKLAQPLFRADIRVLISAVSKTELISRKKSLESALSLYSVPKYQSLRAQRRRYGWLARYRQFAFVKRLPALFGTSNILAASEIAGLYHFPNSVAAKTENVIKSLSKTLPAPVSFKNGTKLDVLLGENHHHGSMTPIGLTAAERDRHVYIIGGTGNGKTTMLLYSIVQDMRNGKGLAVVDPHGDLAETILKHVPKGRINEVIYLNPIDIAYPIGLNLLELPAGLSEDETLIEKDLVTESVISVFRKIFSDDDTGGHRIEYVLRNTIHTAFSVPEATIFTVFKLLTDDKYRKGVTNKLEDGDLKNFWKNELGKAGEFQRVKMSAGITAKIGRFRFNESAKRIMEQPYSTIDFDDILNSGKLLICNFAKGNLGEDTSSLFGVALLAKLQLAALRRARAEQAQRRPFYVYVDEFQNFATMSFVQLLSEARKYKLFLTMAEQSTSQQEEQRMVNIILANVGTVVCFRSGSPTDEQFVLPLFNPYIEQGEIANLSTYNFYMRIAALQAQEPLSGETVLLDNDGSQQVAKDVIDASRAHYAIKYEVLKPEVVQPDFEDKQVDTGSIVMKQVVKHRKGREQKALAS